MAVNIKLKKGRIYFSRTKHPDGIVEELFRVINEGRGSALADPLGINIDASYPLSLEGFSWFIRTKNSNTIKEIPEENLPLYVGMKYKSRLFMRLLKRSINGRTTENRKVLSPQRARR